MTKTKRFLLAAGIVLATAFTFSCSSDSTDEGGSSPSVGDGGSSSSVDVSSPSSSSDAGGLSSGSGGGTITKSKISGVSQKGPFVEGSTATLYELNNEFAQTGRSFKAIISDNKGSFEIKGVELISPYAMLDVSGFYRNEVTGNLSAAPITLFAIADVREKDNVNVNLLTHLEYYRVLSLAEGGKSVAEAKKQAQEEILAVFGIDGNFANSEDMSIFGTTEGDAALLAISVLLQSNLSEGEFSQRLTNFAQSVKANGKWENETAKTAIADWVVSEVLSSSSSLRARSSSSEWSGYSGYYCRYESTIEYPNNCWAMPTGDMCASGFLTDSCDESSDPISVPRIKMSRIKNNILAWDLSSDVPDFEKYVIGYWATSYGLGGCGSANEGEVKKDNRNIYRICRSGDWTVASTLKYDTYQLACSAANEGEIKKGNVSSIEYICENNAWRAATEFDRDTYQWACSDANIGEIKAGKVSGRDYVCKYGIWQEPSYKDKYCFENKCTYFTDSRDNQRYAYVVIGEQTWMAENLNYAASGSKCVDGKSSLSDNNTAYCDLYGRLYTWETATKVCPNGWHLPNNDEWEELLNTAGGYGEAGGALKASSGWNWNDYEKISSNGTDEFGFTALPGGHGEVGGSYFYGVGYNGYWWSASEYDSKEAYHLNMSGGREYADLSGYGKSNLLSVRCVKD